MERVAFTTTLGEMNRLYGVYCEVKNAEYLNAEQAAKAWSDYETYTLRYKSEHGLN